MDGQSEKIDGGLNLALQVPDREMLQSDYLRYGYNQEEESWQIIVKYIGDIKRFEGIFPNTRVVELLNQYAIITTKAAYIPAIAAMPEIEFVEKPKRLYFNLEQGRSASCVNTVQKNPSVPITAGVRGLNLSGKGVLVGIIDSGERVILLSEASFSASFSSRPSLLRMASIITVFSTGRIKFSNWLIWMCVGTFQ